MFRNLGRKFVGNRFPSKFYSINSVQYCTKTRNVSTFNRINETPLNRNVNSPITSSNLCFHKRQLSISSFRNYCKNEESEKPSKRCWPIECDDELKVGLPSLFDFIGIWFNIFKIRSNYLPTFYLSDFLHGSEIAVEVSIQILKNLIINIKNDLLVFNRKNCRREFR